MTGCNYIDDYIRIVRGESKVNGQIIQVCKEQVLLCDFVEDIFAKEKIRVDTEQLEKYLSLQKYFPFKLFPWEVFCFALHNCVYDETNVLRFPEIFINAGRGVGKNGWMSFEDFCLLTEYNGIKNYNIDIFSMSEKQAKISWQDVYDVLENNSKKMKQHFYWTKTLIKNKKTGSEYTYNTARPQTKDSFRPGKVNFDEIHAYESNKLIDVAITGLGKIAQPRRTFITTNGIVRGGYFDDKFDKAIRILKREIPDNGMLPFLCRLDDEKEIDNPDTWSKANPSLPYFPDLKKEIELEYAEYKENPVINNSFIAKRMNIIPKVTEDEVTKWENILATNKEIPYEKLQNQCCVGAIDFMKTTDLLSAGLLFLIDGLYIWLAHTWIRKDSADYKKIKAPLEAWAAKGEITFVDTAEIAPELPTLWLATTAAKYNAKILKIGIDFYRYNTLRRALLTYYFSADKDIGNVVLIRPQDESINLPLIMSGFNNQVFVWGDSNIMRWATNNSKISTSAKGNLYVDKIQPDARKIDPFKAFISAFIVSPCLEQAANIDYGRMLETFIY